MISTNVKREGNKEITSLTLDRSLHTLVVYSKQMYEDLVREKTLVFQDYAPPIKEGDKAVVICHPAGERPSASSVVFVNDDICMTMDFASTYEVTGKRNDNNNTSVFQEKV